jgi:hypothetical protein
MAEGKGPEQQTVPEDETPKFRKALLGIRSVADIKAILTHQEYEPHVHMLVLLVITFIVGAITLAAL